MGITVKGVPTLAGILSFSLYPQTWFSQLCITAVSVPGTEIGDTEQDGSRFLDNKRITGAIPEMLDDAVEFVRKNMRTKTVIDNDGHRADRTEYPIVAVREAVLNALIHRDYSLLSENTPVSIEMYRDRMEINSKGGIYGGGPLSQLGTPTGFRADLILNVLHHLCTDPPHPRSVHSQKPQWGGPHLCSDPRPRSVHVQKPQG